MEKTDKMWVFIQVFVFIALLCIQATKGTTQYEPIGCFKDKYEDRAMSELYLNIRHKINWTIHWPDCTSIIDECADAAEALGFEFFGVQFYGECWGSKDASIRYGVHGHSSRCKNGVGEDFANMVYAIILEDTLSHLEICKNMAGENTSMADGFTGKILSISDDLKAACEKYRKKLADAEDPGSEEDLLINLYKEFTDELYCIGEAKLRPDTVQCESEAKEDFNTSDLEEAVREMDKETRSMPKECSLYSERMQRLAGSGYNMTQTLSAAKEFGTCNCDEANLRCGKQIRSFSKVLSQDLGAAFDQMNSGIPNPFQNATSQENAQPDRSTPTELENFSSKFSCGLSLDPVRNCYGVGCIYPPVGPGIELSGTYCFPAELRLALAFCVPPISDFINLISTLPFVGSLMEKLGFDGGCLKLGSAGFDLARATADFNIGPRLSLGVIVIEAKINGFLRYGAPDKPDFKYFPCSREQLDKKENGQNHIMISFNIGIKIRYPWIKWCKWWFIWYPCGGGIREKSIASFSRSLTHRFAYNSPSFPTCSCCSESAVSHDKHISDPWCSLKC